MKKNILNYVCILALGVMYIYNAHADMMSDCMSKISNNAETWTNILDTEIFPNASELTQEYVTANKPKILTAIAGNLLTLCTDKISYLAGLDKGLIHYTRDNKKYAFDFKVADLFDYIQMPLAIMIYNKTNLTPGDVIQLSDIPSGSAGRYWSDACGDHSIWDGVDMDTAVVKAGKQAFTDYMTNSRNEFFIDFPEGDDRRAFPGLIILDKRGSTTEEIVRYSNLVKAKSVAQNFTTGLKNNAGCQNQNLAVYVVNTNISKSSSSNDTGWQIAAGIGGGSLALVGINTAIISNVSLSTAAATVLTSSAIPVVGWIVAGVAAITAGVITTLPKEIQHIEQVMVMDGPYII